MQLESKSSSVTCANLMAQVIVFFKHQGESRVRGEVGGVVSRVEFYELGFIKLVCLIFRCYFYFLLYKFGVKLVITYFK